MSNTMQFTNREQKKYTATAMGLHWLTALLIIGALVLGWVMVGFPKFSPAKLKYFAWHKWIGVTVFALTVLRVLWRACHLAPPLPAQTRRWQRFAAHFVHALLYMMMFAMPLSGYFYSSSAGVQVVYLGVIPLPTIIGPNPALKPILKSIHIAFSYALVGLIIVHLLALIKHQWIDRDGLLARMLPFLKIKNGSPPASSSLPK